MKKMDKMANVATPGGISTACSAVADSVSTSRSHGAEFFAVASGVQIPYVGRDETGVNASRINSPIFSDEFPPRLPQYHSLAPMISLQNKQLPKDEPLAKLAELFSQYQPLADRRAKKISHSYLKKISSDLVFDDMVLQDRAPHTLPYDENDLHSVFKSGGICNANLKTQIIGLGGRHDPRGVVKRHALCHLKRPGKLKPLRREKTSPARGDTGKLIPTTKLKETHSSPGLTLSKGSERHEWDEYVLACLSQSTAKLIINEQPSGSDKERLTRFVEKRIRASQGKTADRGLSDCATEEMKTSAIKEKAKDVKRRESKQTLEIHYSPSFTLPPAVGDKKLKTDNIFQQELLGGAQPVPSKKPSESSYIILDTNDKLKFQRQLQENYPQGSEVWYSKRRMPVKKTTEKPQRKPSKLVKGLQRWKELPVVVQDDYYAPVVKESGIDVKTFSNAYKEKKKMREDSNVVKIVEEWRSKWFLESHWQRCETEELIKAMGDINDHIRLSAVSACSKAAELRHSKKQEHHLGILLDKSKGPSESLEVYVEPELISAVTKLLDDRNPQVRVAAAITLYSLKKHNDDAESILLWAMEHGGPPEKWAATQCLALSGVITDKIIVELVSQLHADNAVRTEKAGNLLAQLSHQSDVVQTLIAELLNSNSWKDRLTACKVIPKLRGGPNKDMSQKLSYLMWNDWSKDVRSTAAQALGKTGNGKLVHDALRERMLTGNDRIKVDALKKLSNLGIMTARLLPALQECFKSEYVSVRIEAAMVAGKLKISDQGVLNSLLRLASEDDSWKVKAHTIKALGAIGLVDEKLIEVLLWSIRYERVPAVRAEACNAVATLGLRDERLLSVLQDRLVVETEDIVKREAIMTLESLGVEPTGDKEMIEAIRQEVKRLCKRDVIVAHILEADQAAEYKSDYKRLLIPETEEHPSLRVASRTTKLSSRAVSRATSESSRGFDPIVAGYHARERMSRAPTPGELIMKRSLLPLDLNSTSSENSDRVSLEKWEDLSDESDIDEGSGNELGPNGVLTEAEKLEEDNDLDKKRESASCVISASQPRKNDLSEGQKVTLPSADAGGNDCQNSQISSEVELDNDYTELPKPNDEMSERTISLPGFSDTEQGDENEDNFRSDVHPTQHNGP